MVLTTTPTATGSPAAYIGQEGPLQLVAPRMGGGFWVNEAEGKPWVVGPRLILEPIAPLEALRETPPGLD